MTADEMRYRIKILSGEAMDETNDVIAGDANFERLRMSGSESDEEGEEPKPDGELSETANRRDRVNNLVYNHSDDEEDSSSRAPLKRKKKDKPKKKFDIFDMILDEGKQNVVSVDEDSNDLEMDSENLHQRLAQLVDSDDSDNENRRKSNNVKKKTNRKRMVIDNSDSDTELADKTVTSTKSSDVDNDEFSSQAISRRLAELVDSDDSDNDRSNISRKNESGKNIQSSKRNANRRAFLMESDDSDNDERNAIASNHSSESQSHALTIDENAHINETNDTVAEGVNIGGGDDANDMAKHKNNNKRERSTSAEAVSDDEKTAAKKRKNVIDDDDEDE